ncbi:GFA family protein [Piscirickettsia litoralis]|uniref:ADP-ribosylglycohydrolase n=1 Tax=Piscirickettsia litoralis TaxID=1891921 RepID=A0ABX3A398_9GAMM|nr:GFA family protein [Piscirickettsia litoralis]ODN41920.1 ADP-ribosylglycohydrolase [Piscirickettsia litoralis]
MKQLTGSCLCNNIEVSLPDDFDYMGNCHCSECRKLSGSDYAAVGGIDSDKFQLVRGQEYLHIYHKSDETDITFCKNCSSTLFSRKKSSKKHNIRLGILDNPPRQKPSFHIFTKSKAPWSEITDNLPQFEKQPD